jgi:hypothetical protein
VTTTLREIAQRSRHPALLGLLETEQADEEMPVDVPDAAGSQEQVKAAFRALVVAAFDDESLDIPATLARIKEILKSYEKLVGRIAADGGGSEVEEPAPPEETQESLAAVRAEVALLREDFARLHRREAARQVLESAGVDPRDLPRERLRLLQSQADEPAMQALIESWPPYIREPRRTGPSSAAHPFREAARPDRYPQSLDEFVASVK